MITSRVDCLKSVIKSKNDSPVVSIGWTHSRVVLPYTVKYNNKVCYIIVPTEDRVTIHKHGFTVDGSFISWAGIKKWRGNINCPIVLKILNRRSKDFSNVAIGEGSVSEPNEYLFFQTNPLVILGSSEEGKYVGAGAKVHQVGSVPASLAYTVETGNPVGMSGKVSVRGDFGNRLMSGSAEGLIDFSEAMRQNLASGSTGQINLRDGSVYIDMVTPDNYFTSIR